MGLRTRIKLWLLRRKSLRITLGVIPLPYLVPDARSNLNDIYSKHKRKGYRLVEFWDVLVLHSDEDHFRMQFYPMVNTPQECLAVALKGKHTVRFVPMVFERDELDELYRHLRGKETFEQSFSTEPPVQQEGLVSLEKVQLDAP